MFHWWSGGSVGVSRDVTYIIKMLAMRLREHFCKFTSFLNNLARNFSALRGLDTKLLNQNDKQKAVSLISVICFIKHLREKGRS